MPPAPPERRDAAPRRGGRQRVRGRDRPARGWRGPRTLPPRPRRRRCTTLPRATVARPRPGLSRRCTRRRLRSACGPGRLGGSAGVGPPAVRFFPGRWARPGAAGTTAALGGSRTPRGPRQRLALPCRLRASARRAGLPGHHGPGAGGRARRDSAHQAARDSRTLAGTTPVQSAPDAEEANHARARRDPLPGHPLIAVRRPPVRSEADRVDLPECLRFGSPLPPAAAAERIERVMTMTETEFKISEEPLAERVLRQVRPGKLDESRLLPSAEKRTRAWARSSTGSRRGRAGTPSWPARRTRWPTAICCACSSVPPIRQVRRDPRRSERVTARRGRQSRGPRTAVDHRQNEPSIECPARQPAPPRGRRS